MTREEIIRDTVGIEGGYVNHPNDSGGATRWGITESLAREYGYQGAMHDLPIRVAEYIYQKEFWDVVRGDELLEIDEDLAAEVFDTAVNAGPARSGGFLQTALNLLNLQAELYDDIEEDGIIGSRTISAVKAYSLERDVKTLVKLLNCFQGAYYAALASEDETQEDFLYGWLEKRVRF